MKERLKTYRKHSIFKINFIRFLKEILPQINRFSQDVFLKTGQGGLGVVDSSSLCSNINYLQLNNYFSFYDS